MKMNRNEETHRLISWNILISFNSKGYIFFNINPLYSYRILYLGFKGFKGYEGFKNHLTFALQRLKLKY